MIISYVCYKSFSFEILFYRLCILLRTISRSLYIMNYPFCLELETRTCDDGISSRTLKMLGMVSFLGRVCTLTLFNYSLRRVICAVISPCCYTQCPNMSSITWNTFTDDFTTIAAMVFCCRTVMELRETLKAKSEEGDAYIAEIEVWFLSILTSVQNNLWSSFSWFLSSQEKFVFSILKRP